MLKYKEGSKKEREKMAFERKKIDSEIELSFTPNQTWETSTLLPEPFCTDVHIYLVGSQKSVSQHQSEWGLEGHVFGSRVVL